MKNHKKRVNVNSNFKEWETILKGLPQGSILDLLLFNILMNGLFIVANHSHLSNYADSNTLYCFGSNINDVNYKLKIHLAQVMEWLNENYMVLNADKGHYICLGKDTENAKFHFAGNTYDDSKEEKNIRYCHI